MAVSPLDSPLINRRCQKKFGCTAPELLEQYEAGTLTDPKALKMGAMIAGAIDRQDERREKEVVEGKEKLPLTGWRHYARLAFLWSLPVIIIVFVLLTRHVHLVWPQLP